MSDSMKLQGEVSLSVEPAVAALGKVGSASDKMAVDMQKAGERAGAAIGQIGEIAKASGEKLTREESKMVSYFKKLASEAAQAKSVAEGLGNIDFNIAAKGLDPAKFSQMRDVVKAVSAESIAAAAAMASAASHSSALAGSALNSMGMSAKATSAALRGVPAQFTDIITSLQSGQAPLTVFMQQGGQLKDMFGGAGNAAKALGGYVLGLLNPLTVTAGAAAALAVAYHQGAAEAEAFNKSLIMTGNIAGTTAGQLGDMAKTVAGSSGATIGAVAETLNEITTSGKVSADMLAKVAQAAIDMERAGGSAAADTVKEFSSLGDAPVAALIKLNDKYHFLTASVYEQVKALQDQGRETDAAKLAQDTYANAIESRIPSLVQNLGLLESAWKGLAGVAKGAWDTMAGIGRTESLNDQLAAVNKKIEFASSSPVWGDIYNNSDQDIALLEKQKRVIQSMIEGERSVTAQVAAQNKAREAGLAWSQESTKYADQQAKKQAEILRVTTMMTEAGKTQTEIAKVLAQVEEKYAEKKGAAAKAAKEEFTELFQRAEQMKSIYAALGIELKEIDKAYDDQAKALNALYGPMEKEAAALEEQLATYGLTRSEIEATVLARLEEQKIIASQEGMTDLIANLEREIDARKRIAAASASIESRKATDDAAKHAADEWKKTSDKIEGSITDALMRGFESGKSFAENLRDTFYNMFKTLVLRPVIQATVMGGMSALGMGSALASEGSSIGGLGSIASLGNSAYNVYAGGTSSLFSGFATSGIGQSLGLGTAPAYYAAGDAMIGSGLTSAGSAIGAAIPYVGVAVAAAAAIASMLGKGGGPKTEGGYYGVLTGSGGSTAQEYSTYGNPQRFLSGNSADGQLAAMAPAITKAIDGLIGSLGGSSAGIGINYGYSTDPQGTSNDAVAAAVSDAHGFAVYGNNYSVEAGKASEALALESQRMILASVKAAEGIKPIFKEVVAGIDLATASAETLSQAISDVQGIAGLRAAFDTLNLGADKLSMSLISSAGGVSTLTSELSSYYDNYFTAAEKNAKSSESMAKSFSALGMAMPESKDAFRAVVEGLDLTTAAGQTTFSAMMAMSSTFATVADAAAAANGAIANTAAALAKLAETRASLTASFTAPTTLAQATETVQASGLIDLAGMDAEAIRSAMRTVIAGATQTTLDTISGLLPAFEQVIQGISDAADFAEERAASVRAERDALQGQIDALTMTSAQSREKELSALDAGNRALQERIYALNDEADAAAASAAVLAKVAAERAGIQDKIDALTMSTAESRAKELSALDSSNRALQERIYALNDEAAAATAAAAASAAVAAKVSAAQESQAAQMANYLSAQRSAQQAVLNEQKTAISAQASAAESIADAFDSIIKSLSAYQQELVVGNDSILSPQDKYAEAKRVYESTAAKAKIGDKDAAGLLQSATSDFLAASKAVSDSTSYALDFGSAMGSIDSVIGTAGRQKSIAQQQLDVAQQQLDALNAMAKTLGGSSSASTPTAIKDFATASKQWQDWIDTTSVGQSTSQADYGTMTRLSADKAMLTDLAGNSFITNLADGYYGLANQSTAFADALVRRFGTLQIPGYAAGGDFGGGLRLVGENGPELEVTGPARIYSADMTRGMLGGGGTKRLEALVERLIADNERISAELRAIAGHANKTAKTLDRVMPDGDALQVRVAA